MSANLKESGCLRRLDHDEIDRIVIIRREWVGRLQDYYRSSRAITDEMVENLHSMCDVLTSATHPYRLTVGYNQVRVYTNHPELFNDIVDNVAGLTYPHYTKAVVDRPRNTVRLKESAYTHRTYLKSVVVTDQQRRSISKFLTGQDNIRLSPGLKNWTLPSNWRTWTEPYYFVDHTDTAWMTMLSLIYPGLIKNTIQIIKS